MAKQTVLLPGNVLKESFLDKYQITVAKLSQDIGLSPSAIRQLINNKLKISIVIALKLEKYFDKPVKYWIDLQNAYELSALEKNVEVQDALKKIPKAQKAPKAPPAKKTAAKAASAKAATAKAATGTRGRGAKKAEDKKPAGRKPAAPKAAKALKAVVKGPKAPRKPRTPKKPAGIPAI
jgi:addiction module HigA family antidote